VEKSALSNVSHSREDLASKLAEAESLAVFCDFDGTFSVQDVGSTLARTHLDKERAELWARYEAGELEPWEYNMELLDGFEFAPDRLQSFLEEIDLDPGAHALVNWCKDAGVPFRILSDGFDYNLDRLQKINDVAFDYVSNHLEYHGDVWHLAAGRPNPSCGCGTGTCKRGIINEARAKNPKLFCVHVGNGRVSDLCGCVAADLAFAKDTLAPALDALGESYEPFETLHDVIEVLDPLQRRANALRSGTPS
jgi:2-hydroxy-3-keto-5-methylthiopentenyl-1-phosphate phosphatase